QWLYSWHFYPLCFDTTTKYLDPHISRAAAWGVPLWLGEFSPVLGQVAGVYGGAKPNPCYTGNPGDTAKMMSYFRNAGTSWRLGESKPGGGFGLEDFNGRVNQTLLQGLQQGF